MTTKKPKPLDYLAFNACEVLEQNCGKIYADTERRRLAGEDRFTVLVWLNELDSSNLAALAQRLNISVERLDITRQTARRL